MKFSLSKLCFFSKERKVKKKKKIERKGEDLKAKKKESFG